VFEHLSAYLHQLGLGTYAPEAWKEVTYDRTVATIGTAVTIIQLLLERHEKEPRVRPDPGDQQNRRDMLGQVRR
jgi:hypothetical protein